MKKILALLLAAMMVIPMAACNQAQSDGSTAGSTPSSSTPSGSTSTAPTGDVEMKYMTGEELGFVGCVAVIAAFCALIWYGFRTASRAEDAFSAFAAAGLTSVIAFQTLLNIAVVTGSIPPTGLPMPFLGYGGSSLVTFCSAVGMIDSIARRAPERLCPVPIRAVG